MSFLAQIGRTGTKRLAPGARVLYQAEQLRHFADAPPAAPAAPAEDDDMVLTAFREQQQQYQALMNGLQSINIPLTGDDAAVKQYAQEVESLKKKIGMPDVEEVIDAELNYKFAVAGYDIRKFVSSALEGLKLDGMDGLAGELLGAVAEAEKASGRGLDAENEQGWQVLTSRLEAIERKYGLQDKSKVRDDAIFDMYKSHIKSLRTQVEDDINKAREADGLEWISPDIAALKPKLT